MAAALDVLIIEDHEKDAALLVRQLRKGGFEPDWERVESGEALREALRRRRWDVVLADYRLPSFTAPDALVIAKELAPDVPFIVVSGAIGEELAVEMMRAGARDYVMKDKLARLAPAVQRELDEALARRVRQDRDRFFADAARELTKVLAYPGILDIVAGIAVVRFADGVVIEISDEVPPRIVTAHRVPERRRALADIARASAASREASATATASRLQERAPESFIRVPLRARGRRFGEILFLRDGSAHRFAELDVETARDLSVPIAFAIENARLYREAQESIRARDEFLAIAEHELKTPLTPLRMQTQGLLRALDAGRAFSVENLRERLERVDRASSRLERLVEVLLVVSELTVGRMVLDRRDMDLAAAVRRVVDRLRPEIERSGSAVTVRAEPAVGIWDARRIEQACENLLANAVKYGAGRPIEVTVEDDRATVRFSVRDHGEGISHDDQQRLFERFERRASLQHFGGFGLGLWVVRQIVDAHGGRIHLCSRPGLGSRFTLELPREGGPNDTQPTRAGVGRATVRDAARGVDEERERDE